MTDFAVKRIDEMEAIYAGAFKRARAELGIHAFGLQVIDMPLAVRAARAEVAWLKDLANKQQQQQIDESKQAKPKL